jgi:hypothetical protein
MSNKLITYLLVGIFAAIILYEMSAVLYTVASPNTSEDLALLNATAKNTTNEPIVVVNSVSNATYTIPAARVTNNDYSVTITTNGTEANGTYTVDYDYEANSTVWGMDLAFIAIIVFIGIGLFIVYAFMFKR